MKYKLCDETAKILQNNRDESINTVMINSGQTDVGNSAKMLLSRTATYNSRTFQVFSKASPVFKHFQAPWVFKMDFKHFQVFLEHAIDHATTTTNNYSEWWTYLTSLWLEWVILHIIPHVHHSGYFLCEFYICCRQQYYRTTTFQTTSNSLTLPYFSIGESNIAFSVRFNDNITYSTVSHMSRKTTICASIGYFARLFHRKT